MRSPILALSWELWRRGRNAACLALGIIVSCVAASLLATDKPGMLDRFEALLWFLMVCSMFLTFSIFHYAEANRMKDWHGFPYRTFTLPVPTWVLVGTPMLLGVVSTGLVYVVWAKLVFVPLGKVVIFWPGLCLMSAIACYQAIIWGLAGFRLSRIFVLSMGAMLFMNLAMLPLYDSFLPWPIEKAESVAAGVVVLLALAAFFGAWMVVGRQRHGGGRGRGWLMAQIRRASDALPRRSRAFGSPMAAQFWLEWRRAGLLLPVTVGAVVLIVFLPVSWEMRRERDSTFWILGWLLALPVILAVVIGKGFAKPDFWSNNFSIAQFTAIRPMSSGDMVVAKLKVAAVSTGITWMLVIGYMAVWLSKWADTRDLADLWDEMLILHGRVLAVLIMFLAVSAAIIMTWRGMVGGLWAGLSGSAGRYAADFVLGIVVVGAGISGVAYWVEHFKWTELANYVSWIYGILVAAVMVKLWLAAYSWNKITPRRTAIYMLVWVAGTGGLVVLALLVCPNIFWLKHILILAALVPFPLARLGLAPGALARNRQGR